MIKLIKFYFFLQLILLSFHSFAYQDLNILKAEVTGRSVILDNDIEKASINALPGLCKPVTDGWDCEQYDYHQGLLINKRVNKFYSCLQFSNGKLIKNNFLIVKILN